MVRDDLFPLEPNFRPCSHGLNLLGKNSLMLEGKVVPLITGELQFFRMDPETWEPALLKMKAMGIVIVSSYIGWRKFSLGPDQYDLIGETNPQLNVPAFLDLCKKHGFWVVLKPGPWMCAEDKNGGYPTWLVKKSDLQVLNAQNQVVQGYNFPFQSPIPSYLHPEYQDYTRKWLRAVDDVVRPYCYPTGPVIMIQLDNEPCYTFHDGLLESDYNAINTAPNGYFQLWLKRKYETIDHLNGAYGSEYSNFETVEAPRVVNISNNKDLERYHDWVDFKEWILARHIASIRDYHLENGLEQVLFTINYNEHAQLAVPNNWGLLEKVSGIGGFDYYPRMPIQYSDFVMLAQSVNYSCQVNRIPWSPEIMAGIWNFEGSEHAAGELKSREYEYLYLTCMAFGLKGMNFYMLVDRDNWVNSPIDSRGHATETVESVYKVMKLFEKIKDYSLLEKEQTIAVLYNRRDVQESFIAQDKPIILEGYSLGMGYEHFKMIYRELLKLNIDPAIVDLDAGSTALDSYQLIIVPVGQRLPERTQKLLLAFIRNGGQVMILLSDGMRPVSEGALFSHPEVKRLIVESQGKLGHVIVGKGNIWCAQNVQEASRLHTDLEEILVCSGNLPKILTNLPGVMAITHRNTSEHILFLLNSTNDSLMAELIFKEQQAEVMDLFTEQRIMVKENLAHFDLEPRQVRVFRLL